MVKKNTNLLDNVYMCFKFYERHTNCYYSLIKICAWKLTQNRDIIFREDMVAVELPMTCPILAQQCRMFHLHCTSLLYQWCCLQWFAYLQGHVCQQCNAPVLYSKRRKKKQYRRHYLELFGPYTTLLYKGYVTIKGNFSRRKSRHINEPTCKSVKVYEYDCPRSNRHDMVACRSLIG